MKQYITTAEAVELSEQNTLTDCNTANDIYDAYTAKNASLLHCSKEWLHLCALGTVFAAGRVAGIRQERARRKSRAAV
jgi:hypothetical protein